MDWSAAFLVWLPGAFILLLLGAGAWHRVRQRRRTIVCPTCGGLGRVVPPTAGAGRE
jgi:uncharacterized membrane protein